MADVQEKFHRLQRELENRSQTTTIVESGILTIILLVTLLGNFLVCRAVYQNPRLRTITNYSVVVLALTDISMALFVMPLVLSVSILGKRPFGHVLCQIQAYVAVALVFSSIFVVSFMSLNRYFKIVRSNHLYRKVFTRKKTLLMLFVLLILAWLGPLGSFIPGREFQYHPGKMICTFRHSQKQKTNLDFLLGLLQDVLLFFLPYGIMIFCYCRIYMKVRSHNKSGIANAAPSTTNNTTTINRKDINITKTLFAIFIAFTLCIMQLLVIDTMEYYTGEYELPRQVYVFFTVMCGLASAVNPFIYGLFNPAFRSEYKRSFCLTSRIGAGNVAESS